MTSIADHLASYPNSWSQYHVTSWSSLDSTNVVELRINIAEIMTVQKQSMPSFASIISVLSIVFYCVGFLRVELELHDQKKRINALESAAEAKSPSNDADVKIIKNAPDKFVLCNLEITSCVTIMKKNHQNQSLSQMKILWKELRVKTNNEWTCSCLLRLCCADAKKTKDYQVKCSLIPCRQTHEQESK